MTFKSKDTSFEGSTGAGPVHHSDDTQKLSKSPLPESDFKQYVYNNKTREIFGRTLKSWFAVMGYSWIFSASVAAFWGVMLWVFYQTLDNYSPRLKETSSFIGTNPGLGFRPLLSDQNPYSSLIWFQQGAGGDWADLKNNLDKFLAEYEPGYWANAGASQTKCHWGQPPLKNDQACEFNLEWLSDVNSDIKCISEEHYGFYHGKPCLLLKLNRIYQWQPQPYYNLTEVENHPEMPKAVKSKIRQTWEDNCRGRGEEKEQKCPQLDMVWLHCDGEDDPDKENIGSVTYTPWMGFPTYYFPYFNQLGYLQPFVMVQLKNPNPGVLIRIYCTAWAKDIEHDKKTRKGGVHMEFIMD